MQKLISFVVATLIVFGSAALGFHLHANVQIVAQPSRFLDVKIERSMAVDDITWQEPKEVQQDFFTRDSDFYGDVYGQERDLSELPQDRLAPKQYQVGTEQKDRTQATLFLLFLALQNIRYTGNRIGARSVSFGIKGLILFWQNMLMILGDTKIQFAIAMPSAMLAPLRLIRWRHILHLRLGAD